MQFDEHTSIGGDRRTFETTHWSIVEKIKSDDASCNKALVEELLGRYWKPVYCYLRQKGYNNEQAKDLTQGFFQEVVLGRKLVQQANHSKGRFRTFLLTALNRYLTSEYRKQTAHLQIQFSHKKPTCRSRLKDWRLKIRSITPGCHSCSTGCWKRCGWNVTHTVWKFTGRYFTIGCCNQLWESTSLPQ